jgi:hypothetical protein
MFLVGIRERSRTAGYPSSAFVLDETIRTKAVVTGLIEEDSAAVEIPLDQKSINETVNVIGISGQLAWVTVIRAPRDDNTTLRQTPAPTRSAGLKFQPRVAEMTSQSGSHKRFSSGLAVLALKSLSLTLPPARARVRTRRGPGCW